MLLPTWSVFVVLSGIRYILQFCETLFKRYICLFVCLFGGFHSYGDITIAKKGLQIFTNARHSLPLNSDGSLACHIYCNIGYPFVMVISEDPCHSNLLPSVYQWSCQYLFIRLRYVADGIRTHNLPLARRTLWSTASPQRFFPVCITAFIPIFVSGLYRDRQNRMHLKCIW